jgi:molybdopterin converting factor subunit 1
MNQIKVLFFASLKDRIGLQQVSISLPDPLRVVDLRSHLASEYPQANASLTKCLVAINKTFAFDQDIIPPGAEVAFFPPVSGG